MATALAKLLILPFCAPAIFAIAFGTWNALDNAHLLSTVGSSTTTAERARGVATFEAELPPCIASYRSGKSTNHTHFSGESRVRFADGTEYTLPGSQAIKFFQNEPPRASARGNVESTARKHLARIRPEVTEFKSLACLAPKEKVWVEACVKGDNLIGCDDHSEPILLSVGGAAARTAYVMSHAHGSIALALLGVLVLLAFVVGLARHGRPVVAELARTHGISGPGAGSLVLVALAGIGTFISLTLWATTYGPWFLCAFVSLIALVAMTSSIGRLRVLGSAQRVLQGTGTTHLHSEQGLDREVAVRVADDAPQVAGFRAGQRHALVSFRIVERFTEMRGSKRVVTTREVAAGLHPKLVPIVDASGRGMLSLDHCTLDAPRENEEVWSAEWTALPDWGAAVIGELQRSQTHRGYDVFWSAVSPGDALLIYGGVERVRPASIGAAHLEGGYRASPEIPLVGGQSGKPAIAYVGTEAALASGIRRERSTLAIMLAVGTVVAVGAAFALAWVTKT